MLTLDVPCFSSEIFVVSVRWLQLVVYLVPGLGSLLPPVLQLPWFLPVCCSLLPNPWWQTTFCHAQSWSKNWVIYVMQFQIDQDQLHWQLQTNHTITKTIFEILGVPTPSSCGNELLHISTSWHGYGRRNTYSCNSESMFCHGSIFMQQLGNLCDAISKWSRSCTPTLSTN